MHDKEASPFIIFVPNFTDYIARPGDVGYIVYITRLSKRRGGTWGLEGQCGKAVMLELAWVEPDTYGLHACAFTPLPSSCRGMTRKQLTSVFKALGADQRERESWTELSNAQHSGCPYLFSFSPEDPIKGEDESERDEATGKATYWRRSANTAAAATSSAAAAAAVRLGPGPLLLLGMNMQQVDDGRCFLFVRDGGTHGCGGDDDGDNNGDDHHHSSSNKAGFNSQEAPGWRMRRLVRRLKEYLERAGVSVASCLHELPPLQSAMPLKLVVDEATRLIADEHPHSYDEHHRDPLTFVQDRLNELGTSGVMQSSVAFACLNANLSDTMLLFGDLGAEGIMTHSHSSFKSFAKQASPRGEIMDNAVELRHRVGSGEDSGVVRINMQVCFSLSLSL